MSGLQSTKNKVKHGEHTLSGRPRPIKKIRRGTFVCSSVAMFHF